MTRWGIGVVDTGIGKEKSIVQCQDHSRDASHDLVRLPEDQLHLSRVFFVLASQRYGQIAWLDLIQIDHPSLRGGDDALGDDQYISILEGLTRPIHCSHQELHKVVSRHQQVRFNSQNLQ